MEDFKLQRMKVEDASRLVASLLDVFKIVFSFSGKGLYISEPIDQPSPGTICRVQFQETELSPAELIRLYDAGEKINCTSNYHFIEVNPGEDFAESFETFSIFGDRLFRTKVYTSPTELGLESMHKDYDSKTYLCVDLHEHRATDFSEKYNMIFGFDIKSMEFLELLDLDFTNVQNIIRYVEDDDLFTINEKFKGWKFLLFQRADN